MLVAPCRDCERSGCGSFHDQCENYQEFAAAKSAIGKAKRKEEMNRNCRPPKSAKVKNRKNYG